MENKISELSRILGQSLKWHKARLICFSMLVIALFACRTICLYRLAVVMASDAELASRYKRSKRFFSTFVFDTQQFAQLLLRWFIPEDKEIYLILDRTNWFLGKAKINVFMLGVAYEGIAIPLFWQLLPKAGNATAQEHIELLQRFCTVFHRQPIHGVLGDREFATGKLFRWCRQHEIPFYIRIKEGSDVRIKSKKIASAKKLFRHLHPKQQDIFRMDVEVFGQKVYLAGSRSESGELMIVATNQLPKNAIAIYLRRWEIENLFQCLKGRGFQFESTHITELERLDKLVALLAVGFCWAHKVGEWLAIKKPIPLNQYRDSRRPQYSYFRYGLDFLQALIFSGKNQALTWRSCFQMLSPPRWPSFQEERL